MSSVLKNNLAEIRDLIETRVTLYNDILYYQLFCEIDEFRFDHVNERKWNNVRQLLF